MELMSPETPAATAKLAASQPTPPAQAMDYMDMLAPEMSFTWLPRSRYLARTPRRRGRRSSTPVDHHGDVRRFSASSGRRAQPLGWHSFGHSGQPLARQAASSWPASGRVRRLRPLLPRGPQRALAPLANDASPRTPRRTDVAGLAAVVAHSASNALASHRASPRGSATGGGARRGHDHGDVQKQIWSLLTTVADATQDLHALPLEGHSRLPGAHRRLPALSSRTWLEEARRLSLRRPTEHPGVPCQQQAVCL